MSQMPNPSNALVPLNTAQMLAHTAKQPFSGEEAAQETKRTRGKGRKHDFIGNRWMNVDQVYEFFGGVLTLSEVRYLMENKHIKSFWKTGAKKTIFAARKDVEQWADDIERCRDVHQTRSLGAEFIVPVASIRDMNVGKKRV